jgi:hypothetical protein
MGGTPDAGNHPAGGRSPDGANVSTQPNSVPRALTLRLTPRHVRLRLTGAALVVVTIDRRTRHHWNRARRLTLRATHAGALTLPVRRLAAGRYRVTVHVHVGRRSHTRRVVVVLPRSGH